MTDATFSVVTAVYTIGGLLGSMGANVIMDKYGRRGAVRGAGAFFVVGSGLMGVAGSLLPLIAGRCVGYIRRFDMSNVDHA